MKKRIIALLTAVLMVLTAVEAYAYKKEEMAAAWITTVYSTDFPKTKTAKEQKKEFDELIDNLKDMGINTAIVQVRPKGDALYESEINPWSDVLTGTQGKDPGYDPLEYMIKAAHKRGMDIHAWLNPYRVTTSGTDISKLCETHPARLNPDWVIEHNNALCYDPSNEEVKEHIIDSVKEIIENYDVDGIHFDDYFYPSGYPLSPGEDKNGREANERREHVNDLVEGVYKAIKRSGKDIVFGISPTGICVNEETGKFGSVIRGYEGRNSVYADPRVWIEEGWIDYITPQIYWETTHSTAAFETVVKWWINETKGTDTDLYIGHGLYKDEVAKEIGLQLAILDVYGDDVDGSFFYSTRDLVANRQGSAEAIKTHYGNKAAIDEPVVDIPFVPEVTPSVPETKEPEIILFEAEAIYSASKVMVDNKSISFEAYNIGGYTYFKLRDVAMALNGSAKSFDTLWDTKAQRIDIVTGINYTVAGGELKTGNGKNKKAVLSSAGISLNGNTVSPLAYNINGNNYFKLRDLGDLIGFGVEWNDLSKTIEIKTK